MDSIKKTQQPEQSQPEHKDGLQTLSDNIKAQFEHHKAAPGPAIPKDFDVQEEGTKEERRAKAKELNK
ncbi:hypothetical protein B0H67DRAFT_638359 [Lasiosphaeris hirsuta]|uniref:Uncharacterized protein n=1 Tax=Lasiosphaeris hirsuta TaxID=260670 RepID=A0AA40B8T2_9PEZI|nr:hypothetical protein B0H67DRAFT_638359 [Lasiosphaeris hirsuta]